MKQKSSPVQKALNLWAIILIIWAVYRAKFRLPEWFDEFIAKPLVFILPVFYFIKKVEKKNFFLRIDLHLKNSVKDILWGLVIGGVFIIVAIISQLVKFGHVVFITGQNLTLLSILIILLTALATSISEEILSRGFILKRLYEDSKNIFTSSFFASILFFFLHVPILFTNVKITGNILLFFMATDLILSLTNSFIFLDRKSLILPIMIHAVYNISVIIFI